MKKPFLAACAATLLLGATIAPVMAQDAAGDNDANRVAATDVDTRDDDGFDWGLLGLLGLLGLIPRKQRTVVHHDTVRTDSTGTTR
jgi:hypothetical protein